MPFDLTWEPKGAYRRYIGNVTVEERERSFDLICCDARFDELRYVITDYLDVHYYEVSSESTEEIAAKHVAPLITNPNIVIAAVAVDAVVIEAIKHFISLNFITQEYRIFPTLVEARAWIKDHRFEVLRPRPRIFG